MGDVQPKEGMVGCRNSTLPHAQKNKGRDGRVGGWVDGCNIFILFFFYLFAKRLRSFLDFYIQIFNQKKKDKYENKNTFKPLLTAHRA